MSNTEQGKGTEGHAETDKRYKQFRNFMCNELGITRQDIQAWTTQAVANEIEKRLGQMNLEGMVKSAIEKAAREAVGANDLYSSRATGLREALAKELAQRLVISIEPEAKRQTSKKF